MGLQEHFKNFHDKIKLDYDTNAELRDKRDILCGILSNSDKLPGFEILNQGSYSMHTGVVPWRAKNTTSMLGFASMSAKTTTLLCISRKSFKTY